MIVGKPTPLPTPTSKAPLSIRKAKQAPYPWQPKHNRHTRCQEQHITVQPNCLLASKLVQGDWGRNLRVFPYPALVRNDAVASPISALITSVESSDHRLATPVGIVASCSSCTPLSAPQFENLLCFHTYSAPHEGGATVLAKDNLVEMISSLLECTSVCWGLWGRWPAEMCTRGHAQGWGQATGAVVQSVTVVPFCCPINLHPQHAHDPCAPPNPHILHRSCAVPLVFDGARAEPIDGKSNADGVLL